MSLATELAALYRRDLTRLIQEVTSFPDQSTLWATGPGISNSAGNLALHLEGNLREFVGRLLGQIPYERHRPAEFSTSGLPVADIVLRLEEVRELVTSVVSGLTASVLDEIYPEQVLGMPLTSRQFLLHLYAHLSYHLGQIDYLRRMLTNGEAVPFVAL